MLQEDFDYQLNALESEIMKIVQQTNVIYDKLSDLNYNSSVSDISKASSNCKSSVYDIMIRVISAFDSKNRFADDSKMELASTINEYIVENGKDFDIIVDLLYDKIDEINLAISLFKDLKHNVYEIQDIADDISNLMYDRT